jgi:hypothetical protein
VLVRKLLSYAEVTGSIPSLHIWRECAEPCVVIERMPLGHLSLPKTLAVLAEFEVGRHMRPDSCNFPTIKEYMTSSSSSSYNTATTRHNFIPKGNNRLEPLVRPVGDCLTGSFLDYWPVLPLPHNGDGGGLGGAVSSSFRAPSAQR